jgi:hypothetical protein
MQRKIKKIHTTLKKSEPKNRLASTMIDLNAGQTDFKVARLGPSPESSSRASFPSNDLVGTETPGSERSPSESFQQLTE